MYRCEVPDEPSCPTDIINAYSTNDKCGMITNSAGPFKGCMDFVGDDIIFDDYFEDCIFDICMSEDKTKQLCEALAELMALCYSKGYAEPIEWRTNDFCPCKLSFKKTIRIFQQYEGWI